MGYTKLFSEIIMSTVWKEPDYVRIVWITMLALKDRWHIVNASIPGLADASKVSIEQCEKALKILSSPDKYSRSIEHEGRRIEKIDGGWYILNGEKYRNKMSLDERREYQRIKQQEYRQKAKENQGLSISCLQKSQQLTHTDTDTDTETLKPLPNKLGLEESFAKFFSSYPKKLNKSYAKQIWFKLKPDDLLVNKIMSSLENFKKSKDWIKENGQFIPYPSTWLNKKRWEDMTESCVARKPLNIGDDDVC